MNCLDKIMKKKNIGINILALIITMIVINVCFGEQILWFSKEGINFALFVFYIMNMIFFVKPVKIK